ncbi:hypothetical protein AR275_33655 [Stenotrophomonas maltophilia]|nr:hypothetical protein AR275_33655 [Stenotrophomonas maltophilia]
MQKLNKSAYRRLELWSIVAIISDKIVSKFECLFQLLTRTSRFSPIPFNELFGISASHQSG